MSSGIGREEESGRAYNTKRGPFHEVFSLSENERPLPGGKGNCGSLWTFHMYLLYLLIVKECLIWFTVCENGWRCCLINRDRKMPTDYIRNGVLYVTEKYACRTAVFSIKWQYLPIAFTLNKVVNVLSYLNKAQELYERIVRPTAVLHDKTVFCVFSYLCFESSSSRATSSKKNKVIKLHDITDIQKVCQMFCRWLTIFSRVLCSNWILYTC